MRDDVNVLRQPEPVQGARAYRTPQWADDIVVDFPSVAALVERVQAAFFNGEAGSRPMRAVVRVSASQAITGGRVPVEVPLWRPCQACGGRGEVGDVPCAACDGAGDRLDVEAVQIFVPSGVRDGARFLLHLGVPSASPTAVDLCVRII